MSESDTGAPTIDARLDRIRARAREAAALAARAEAKGAAAFEDRLDLLDARQDALEALEAEVEAARESGLDVLIDLLRGDRRRIG